MVSVDEVIVMVLRMHHQIKRTGSKNIVACSTKEFLST